MKIPNFIKVLGILVVGLLLALTVFSNLFMAYIMIAPDDFPKPFRLAYDYGGQPVAANPPAEQAPAENPISLPSLFGQPTAAPTITPVSAAESGPIIMGVRPGEGLMFETGTKIVNLADQTGRNYIKTTIVLEFAPPDLNYYSMPPEEQVAYKTNFETKLREKQPVIDDAIVTLLSQKTFESVYTAEGKDLMRQELMVAVNSHLPEYKVISVYIPEFVIQK
jgi:flagellar basal body-associated protein FliL